MKKKLVYLIGGLKNRGIILPIAKKLEEEGYETFTSWIAPGPDADKFLWDYEKEMGRSYREAIKGYAVQLIYNFDRLHLDRADIAIAIAPLGKSSHVEIGYAVGKGKPVYILLDEEPSRLDAMHAYATDIYSNLEDLIQGLTS